MRTSRMNATGFGVEHAGKLLQPSDNFGNTCWHVNTNQIPTIPETMISERNQDQINDNKRVENKGEAFEADPRRRGCPYTTVVKCKTWNWFHFRHLGKAGSAP